MGQYYIRSIIGEMAKGIEALKEQGEISKNRKVQLYGLDRNSFAMRTILANLGCCNVECYLSEDEAAVVAQNRDIKNFACRFLNTSEQVIYAATLQERLVPFDDGVTVLIASKSYEEEKKKLEQLGYKENVHFYKVYDFKDAEVERLFEGGKKMSLQEIKTVEKEILDYVDALCREHGLRYWVCGGTLLGTIRHKGFIPWDDDIDIFLPWEDYKQLISLFKENDRFAMVGMGTSEVADFIDLFAKVVDKRTLLHEDVGTVRKVNPVWIDIFPLVGLPSDAKQRHLFFEQYQELSRSIWQDFYGTNGKLSVFPKWHKAQLEFLEKYDFDEAEYVGVLGTAYGERDCTTRAVYEETIRLPFEDIVVNAPVGYKEYLDNLYGKDWGVLPEESKRKSHHDIEAYWMQEIM